MGQAGTMRGAIVPGIFASRRMRSAALAFVMSARAIPNPATIGATSNASLIHRQPRGILSNRSLGSALSSGCDVSAILVYDAERVATSPAGVPASREARLEAGQESRREPPAGGGHARGAAALALLACAALLPALFSPFV